MSKSKQNNSVAFYLSFLPQTQKVAVLNIAAHKSTNTMPDDDRKTVILVFLPKK